MSKYQIEVKFQKNRSVPDFGNEAYVIEFHSIYLLYGHGKPFKSSKDAIDFVKSRLTEEAIKRYDTVSITKWIGYSGTTQYIKKSNKKNDSSHIDRKFADNLMSIERKQITFEQDELKSLLTKAFEAGSIHGMRSWNPDKNGKLRFPDNRDSNQDLKKFLKEQFLYLTSVVRTTGKLNVRHTKRS